MRAARLLLLALLLLRAPCPAMADSAGEANEAGAALFNAGSYAEAVAKFREALAFDPGFAPARRNLAVSLAALGQQGMRAGNLDDARLHLEEAARLAPEEAQLPFLLGLLFFGRGDLYEARQRVERALALAPALAPALELSGDIFYREGALERARAAWEAALAATPQAQHDALRAKIQRVVREAGAEPRFGRDVSRHFTIQYEGAVPPAVAGAALRLLEEAYERIWREFGRAPQHDIPVLLYASGSFRDFNPQAPAWARGTFDGKLRIPVGGLASADDAARLAPLLAHELTHAFLRANAPGGLPPWFEEGLAEQFEGTSVDDARHALRAAAANFTSLEQVSDAIRSGTHVGAAYAAAFLAVRELIRRDGFWLPRRILELLAAGRPFEESFRDAAGMTIGEFEETWTALQR